MPNDRPPTVADVEEFIVKSIASGLDSRIGTCTAGLVTEIIERFPAEPKPSRTLVTEAVWGLLSRGLAQLDFSSDPGHSGGNHGDPAKWWLYPTARGRAYAADNLPNPDMPDKYLQEFVEGIPKVSETVKLYIDEALQTYTNRNYIASAVMLGVAAEAAFMEMAGSFCGYLPDTEGRRLRELMDSAKSKYSTMLTEFRKRFEVRRGEFPAELSENIDLQVNSVLDLIRRYRNNSGHPSGFRMNRAECHQSLIAFVHTAQRIYALKAEFETKAGKDGDAQ